MIAGLHALFCAGRLGRAALRIGLLFATILLLLLACRRSGEQISNVGDLPPPASRRPNTPAIQCCRDASIARDAVLLQPCDNGQQGRSELPGRIDLSLAPSCRSVPRTARVAQPCPSLFALSLSFCERRALPSFAPIFDAALSRLELRKGGA